jgi:GTP-binding protein YchF
MLRAGIVGLPNVGKSTIFNALLRAHKATVENYPFCTIEPNLGVVEVPDERLDRLAETVKVAKRIPTTIEFLDIAGLVQGASKGEGLGNKFLSHIREVDAIVHVVRCFENDDVHHVSGSLDPIRDIEVVNTELILADMESVRKHQEKINRDVKRGEPNAISQDAILRRLQPHLDGGQPVATLSLSPEEQQVVRRFCLLTEKPTIFVANVGDTDLADIETQPHVAKVRDHARTHQNCDTVVIGGQLISDLADLSAQEAAEYLHESGVEETGVGQLIGCTYRLLNLRTFFTFNETEVRAWTVVAGEKAPQAAGRIHTDFERGFIKAEVVQCEALLTAGSIHEARHTGHYQVEGKEYEVQDGDVILVKYNV